MSADAEWRMECLKDLRDLYCAQLWFSRVTLDDPKEPTVEERWEIARLLDWDRIMGDVSRLTPDDVVWMHRETTEKSQLQRVMEYMESPERVASQLETFRRAWRSVAVTVVGGDAWFGPLRDLSKMYVAPKASSNPKLDDDLYLVCAFHLRIADDFLSGLFNFYAKKKWECTEKHALERLKELQKLGVARPPRRAVRAAPVYEGDLGDVKTMFDGFYEPLKSAYAVENGDVDETLKAVRHELVAVGAGLKAYEGFLLACLQASVMEGALARRRKGGDIAWVYMEAVKEFPGLIETVQKMRAAVQCCQCVEWQYYGMRNVLMVLMQVSEMHLPQSWEQKRNETKST